MRFTRSLSMQGPWVARLVLWCWNHGIAVCLLAALLAVPCLWSAARTLSLEVDESRLLAADLPLRKAEAHFERAFPYARQRLVAVVEAPTPETAELAAEALLLRLRARPDLFDAVERPPEERFFHRSALLFLSPAGVRDFADHLIHAQPLLGGLAADPSLRGMLASLDLILAGAERGEIPLTEALPAVTALSRVGESVLAGRPGPMSWHALLNGTMPEDTVQRRFVLTIPRLDDNPVVPGDAASHAIRAAAEGLAARVRLTGPTALAGDNFRNVAEGAGLSSILVLTSVTVLLLLKGGSLRLTAAILAMVLVVMAVVSGFAAVAVGRLAPLSLAFVALVAGATADLAVQFVARYRDDLFHNADPDRAMRRCAHAVPRSLLAAASAVALALLSLASVDSRGAAQLGLIGGMGMAAGAFASLTVLPALLRLFKLPPERVSSGFSVLIPLEARISRHALAILILAGFTALAAATVASRLSFDFDPLHLHDPRAESVATFRDLARDPETTPYAIDLLAATASQADMAATRLGEVPEVAFTRRLADFIPPAQDAKLAILDDVQRLLGPSLYPARTAEPPSAARNRAAMVATARRLEVSGNAAAEHLAHILRALLESGRAETFADAAIAGLPQFLDHLRQSLEVRQITPDTLPPDLTANWVGTLGERRVVVYPALDVALDRYVAVVQALDMEVSGVAVAAVEAGHSAMRAFVQAGVIAVLAGLLLLWRVLRRPADVILAMAPLILGGALGMAVLVASGKMLNTFSIAAFPLSLGAGLACNIRFVLGWRAGLKTALNSGVATSALIYGAAFAALALSSHRGAASLGATTLLTSLLMAAASFVLLPAGLSLLEKRRRSRQEKWPGS